MNPVIIGDATLYLGDCMEIMRKLPDSSVDAVVTDPPYGLSKEPDMAEVLRHWMAGDDYKATGGGFMGKTWDSFVPGPAVWKEALRVLKPGGHLLAFFGSRTYDMGTMALRLAGFEVRDQIMWIYGSGFPKSMDVSKAIDKAGPHPEAPYAKFGAHYAERRKVSGLTHAQICAAGGWHGAVNHGGASVNWEKGYAMPTPNQWPELQRLLALDSAWQGFVREEFERQVIGSRKVSKGVAFSSDGAAELDITSPATEAARQWQGWGTALKPAHEPICVARKPLIGTVAENVLAHGTGAINIDGCRVGNEDTSRTNRAEMGYHGGNLAEIYSTGSTLGRWPANVIHDGSEEVIAAFPQAPGQLADASSNSEARKTQNVYGDMRRGRGEEASADSENEGAVGFKMKPGARRLDVGSAARFFYCAKASRADRNAGLGGSPAAAVATNATMREREDADWQARNGNHHPTVKPTDLMAYLCRLVTPPGGVVLDPFMGSGSTGKACMREGFGFIGIDMTPEYFQIAQARIQHECAQVAQQQAAESAPVPQLDLFAGEAA